jgi:hypothetical protein
MRILRITEAHDYDIIGTLLPSTETDARIAAPMPNLIQIAPNFVLPNQIPAR